jgi:hypothetical protein
MAPTLSRPPFQRDGCVHEEKVDGWRMLAYKEAGRVRLRLQPARPARALRCTCAESVEPAELIAVIASLSTGKAVIGAGMFGDLREVLGDYVSNVAQAM